ncbi:hypothetical protein [Burkholderia sp. AW49-1]
MIGALAAIPAVAGAVSAVAGAVPSVADLIKTIVKEGSSLLKGGLQLLGNILDKNTNSEPVKTAGNAVSQSYNDSFQKFGPQLSISLKGSV